MTCDSGWLPVFALFAVVCEILCFLLGILVAVKAYNRQGLYLDPKNNPRWSPGLGQDWVSKATAPDAPDLHGDIMDEATWKRLKPENSDE